MSVVRSKLPVFGKGSALIKDLVRHLLVLEAIRHQLFVVAQSTGSNASDPSNSVRNDNFNEFTVIRLFLGTEKDSFDLLVVLAITVDGLKVYRKMYFSLTLP